MRHGPASPPTADAGTPRPADDSSGFALISAVLALVVVGALLVGGYTAASTEEKVADSERLAGQSLYAAERGMAEALALTLRPVLEAIPLDSTRTVRADTLEGSRPRNGYEVAVRRVGTHHYLFLATGHLDGGAAGAAVRRLAVFARVMDFSGRFDQALLIDGPLDVRGRVTISGKDTIPERWGSCDTVAAKPGIVTSDTVEISGGAARLSGNPAILKDTTLSAEDFSVFGSLTYDDLVAMARAGVHVYPTGAALNGVGPVDDGTECQVGRDNWGDPANAAGPCHYYFPLIHVGGDLDFRGNSIGQGILLVDGDLNLAGHAKFYGIAIVKGKITQDGAGTAQVIGTTLIASDTSVVHASSSSLYGTPTIQYSSCAILRAQMYNGFLGVAVPVAGRAWHDLPFGR